MDESFPDTVHRVIEEHRHVKVKAVDERLALHCRCAVKHDSAMVLGSTSVCSFAAMDQIILSLDATLWMLADLHDTLFTDHEEVTRPN